MSEENQELLKSVPVPYRDIRFDLAALELWTYAITQLMEANRLTRPKVKTVSFACLSVANSNRKDTDAANYYLYRAVMSAEKAGIDLVKLLNIITDHFKKTQ